MLGLLKKILTGLLSVCTIGSFVESLASDAEGRLRCISLNNQSYQARQTLVNINSNQLLYYPFTVSVTLNVVEAVILSMIIHLLEHVFQIR